ncbi:MAG: prolipoprotein diacylglyceryl transferase [Alphaproteobacteria bacterium]|nr:prolipoprotein diacylglyceryl transferase [Alphaproteobacteria bacterium]|tara:strand:- start:25 stop:801 length:777 start_codon:yes stop_codon:yes gene_type:complete
MYEHNLNPVALSFYGINVYWYSLAYIFGFLFSFWYSKFLIKKKILKLDFKIAEDFITFGIIAVILGGRIGYVFFYNFEYYLNDPINILKIWQGGMSFHGALLGLIIYLMIFAHKKKQSIVELANLLAFCSPFGIFLGRIANFINGELIGRETDGSWGIIYKFADQPRHPSQIYEAIFEGLIIFIILFIFSNSGLRKKLNAFSIFLILYSLSRFFIEFFREPDSHLGFIFNNISMGQALTLPMLIFGLIFLKNAKNKQN